MEALGNIPSLSQYYCTELTLVFGIIAIVLLSFRKNLGSLVPMVVGLATVALALVWTLSKGNPEQPMALFGGLVAYDAMGNFFKVIILATAGIAILFSDKSRDLNQSLKPEYYGFLLSLALGLTVMVTANDLLMIYLAIEMASIVSYILTGFISHNPRSDEAGLKYVFYGGLASGIMIFGLSWLYGLTGTLNLIEIREFLMVSASDRLVLFISFIFVLAGLGYKMAIAPFHMWSPDVYEGAPMPVTAFLSVASKAAGFAVTLRFFMVGFVSIKGEQWVALKALDWQTLVSALAVITMFVGNLLALKQTNIKRFLAYSSVAHAGYLLMGVAAQSTRGIEAILFYLVVYFLMNLGAFLVAILINNQFETENMEDYKGLAKRNGFGFFLSFCLSIFLLSLAGIPPFAGFVGKWYIFGAAMEKGLYTLSIFGVINSVISLFYYVRLMKYMMIDEPTGDKTLHPTHLRFASIIGGFAALTVVFGLYFAPIVDWVKASHSFLY